MNIKFIQLVQIMWHYLKMESIYKNGVFINIIHFKIYNLKFMYTKENRITLKYFFSMYVENSVPSK